MSSLTILSDIYLGELYMHMLYVGMLSTVIV